MMVFDLDPGAPADIVQCCQVGIWLRELLGEMKLKAFAKTSGSKGLQVYVPLNTPVTFDQTKDISALVGTTAGTRTSGSGHLQHVARQCAKEKCSSIGARTTNTKPRSASIHFAQRKNRPFPRRSLGVKSRVV